MSVHVCKCEHNGRTEYHLRYPGMTQSEAQNWADKINGGEPYAAPPQEPVPFDQWNSSPYTQVLHETIKDLSQKLASMTQSQPVTLNLAEPFGYVGPSMLGRPPRHTSQTFLGHFDRPTDKDEPVYTLSQIRWACTMAGIDITALREKSGGK